MGKKYDLVVATGAYKNKEGQDKTQWLNIGKVLEKQDGGLVMKLDCTPTSVINRDGNSVAWDGWVQVFESKPREQSGAPQQQSAPEQSAGSDFGEDIPFLDPYKFTSLIV